MKCTVLHSTDSRIRVHLHVSRMSLPQADILEYYLRDIEGVGVAGILTPAVSALAHNVSTIAVSLYNMTPLLPEPTK